MCSGSKINYLTKQELQKEDLINWLVVCLTDWQHYIRLMLYLINRYNAQVNRKSRTNNVFFFLLKPSSPSHKCTMGTSSNTEVFFVRTGENINRIETRRQKIKSLKHLERKKKAKWLLQRFIRIYRIPELSFFLTVTSNLDRSVCRLMNH